MKFNKSIWIGGLIGGLYSLVFHLLFVGLGEVGTILIKFILFLPAFFTFLLLQFIQIMFIIGIVNIFLWILIGAFIGWLIEKNDKKVIIISLLVGVVIILILLYYILPEFIRMPAYSIFDIFQIFVLLIIYFLIKKLWRKK